MADNKKYYYLKLKESFFDSDEIKILESMHNGVYYSNLLMKLYLKSLKSNGELRFNKYIPYDENMIATITNLRVSMVKAGLKVLSSMKLIELLENGTIYMTNIQSFIGKSSSEADRKRIYREEIEEEKIALGQMSDKCPPDDWTKLDKHSRETEIETELELDKELESKTEIDKEDKTKIVSQSTALLHHFESITGIAGGLSFDALKKAIYLHGPENVKMAIDSAVERDKPTMKYINGILRNWAKEGYPREGDESLDGDYGRNHKSNTTEFKGFKLEEPRTLSEDERKSIEKELI